MTKSELEARVTKLEAALADIARTYVNCKSGHHMVAVANAALASPVVAELETDLIVVPEAEALEDC